MLEKDAEIKPMTKKEIKSYALRIFIDTALPRGAERDLIEALGLKDFCILTGYLDSFKGGK